jgi:hypothetical protein
MIEIFWLPILGQSKFGRHPMVIDVFGRHLSIAFFLVCHILALSFTLKNTLRQKKNYGNSNISLCKNIIFKKIL